MDFLYIQFDSSYAWCLQPDLCSSLVQLGRSQEDAREGLFYLAANTHHVFIVIILKKNLLLESVSCGNCLCIATMLNLSFTIRHFLNFNLRI